MFDNTVVKKEDAYSVVWFILSNENSIQTNIPLKPLSLELFCEKNLLFTSVSKII